ISSSPPTHLHAWPPSAPAPRHRKHSCVRGSASASWRGRAKPPSSKRCWRSISDRPAVSASRPTWPESPSGRAVVLNVRVVTRSGGGRDTPLIRAAPHFRRYWPAAAFMHHPNDRGVAALRRLAATHAFPLVSVADRGPLDASVLRELLALCRHLGVRVW